MNQFLHYNVPDNFKRILLRTFAAVFGVCAVLFCLVAFHNWFIGNQTLKFVSIVKSDLRSMHTAIAAYHEEYGSYPDWATGRNRINGPVLKKDSTQVPSFRIWMNQVDANSFATLTSPVPFLYQYNTDRLASQPNKIRKQQLITFAYYSNSTDFLLYSTGPDQDYDLDPLTDFVEDAFFENKKIINQIYDPTNGYNSSGDIIRTKY